MLFKKFFEKKSQVWVETAIYILIGLTVIAIVLAASMPQIEKIKDRAVANEAMDILNEINRQIRIVGEVSGNIKILPLKLQKGRIEINSGTDKITYILQNTPLKLSEPGIPVNDGNIILTTEKYGKNFNLKIELNEDVFDITYNKDPSKFYTLQPGSTTYKLKIENVGDNTPITKTHIDLKVT